MKSKYSDKWCIRMTVMMFFVLAGMMYVCITHCINAGAFAALINLF